MPMPRLAASHVTVTEEENRSRIHNTSISEFIKEVNWESGELARVVLFVVL